MNTAGRSFDDFSGFNEGEDNSESAYPSDTESSSTATPSEIKGPVVKNTLLNRDDFVPMSKTSPEAVEDSNAQQSQVAESKQESSSKKRTGKTTTSSTGADPSEPKRRRGRKTASPTPDKASPEQVKDPSAPKRRRGRKAASPTPDKASPEQVKDSTPASPPPPSTSGRVGKKKKKPSRNQAKRELLLDLIELVDTYPI